MQRLTESEFSVNIKTETHWKYPVVTESLPRTFLSRQKENYYEETGATQFEIKSVCVYSVIAPNNFDGNESFGMLYYAEISEFEDELHSEIEKIVITDKLPTDWTYTEIQPKLLKEVRKRTGK